MSDPLSDIIRLAADLKRVAPDEYNRLIDGLKAIEAATIKELQASPADAILKAQGRSLMATQLRDKLENCIKT